MLERDQRGQVTKRTDARGIVANFTFDVAGRMVSALYPSETASNVLYTYDVESNGKRRLTGVTDAVGTLARSYDALRGNVVESETPGELGRSTHALSWRVVSADEHPVAGSVGFSIGETSARTLEVEEEADWKARGWLWFTKMALYAGLFIGIGGVFARRILMPTSMSWIASSWSHLPSARRAQSCLSVFRGLMRSTHR